VRLIRHITHAEPPVRPRVVAAGGFDGVHRGHQRVLARVIEHARARRGDSVVIVAHDSGDTPRLVDLHQQIELLRNAGIDVLVFAPPAAVDSAVTRLGAVMRVTERRSAAVAPAGGILDQIDPVEHGGERITSAAIRTALACGDLERARAMLGRDPAVGGRVVHGFHRGGLLGIPTANLRVRGVQLPPDGVYAVRVRAAAERLRGVANIGFNPTFGNQTRTLETHVLDFSGDLYRRRLEIAFVARLRGEQKFSDVPALLAQIHADIAAARRRFEAHGG
jgi:riboflavin kinase/FMN adenylyltransferase